MPPEQPIPPTEPQNPQPTPPVAPVAPAPVTPPVQPVGSAAQPTGESKLPLIMVIIALVLFWVPIVGSILAIVALLTKKKRPQAGKLITILAIVVILANIGATFLIISMGNKSDSNSGTSTSSSNGISVDTTCYSAQVPTGFTASGKIVNCSGDYLKTEGNLTQDVGFALGTGPIINPQNVGNSHVDEGTVEGVKVKRQIVDTELATDPGSNAYNITFYIPLKVKGTHGESWMSLTVSGLTVDKGPVSNQEKDKIDALSDTVIKTVHIKG